jgi:hypothetical protein
MRCDVCRIEIDLHFVQARGGREEIATRISHRIAERRKRRGFSRKKKVVEYDIGEKNTSEERLLFLSSVAARACSVSNKQRSFSRYQSSMVTPGI